MSKNKGNVIFYSAYSSEDMLHFSTRSDLYYVIGIYIDNNVIKPVRCKECGEYLYIDTYTGYGQCSYCSNAYKLYTSKSINIRKEWSVYNGVEI